MLAFMVVDAQNEFSSTGQRAVPDHTAALARIEALVQQARERGLPIAWVQHHNRPNESKAFVPGTWGAELSPGLGPQNGFGPEKLFQKDVFGAFGAAGLEEWLRSNGVTQVLIAGFFTHMCVSTSSREALVRGFDVFIDPTATATHALEDPILGKQTADEVRRTALLHLQDMGVVLSADVLREQAASTSTR
jgi:nicotinamidase-related amidase